MMGHAVTIHRNWLLEVGTVSGSALGLRQSGLFPRFTILARVSIDTTDTVLRGTPANKGNYRNSSLLAFPEPRDHVDEVFSNSKIVSIVVAVRHRRKVEAGYRAGQALVGSRDLLRLPTAIYGSLWRQSRLSPKPCKQTVGIER